MGDTRLAKNEIGVVYSAVSGFLRRIYPSKFVPDPLPGEALLVLNSDKLADLTLDTLRAEIAAELGAPALDPDADRTVVIDLKAALVVGVLKADPAIDAIPGFDLKLHPEADVGDQYDAESDSYLRPYAIADAKTGVVNAIEYLGLLSQSPTPPQDQILVSAGGLKVGDLAFDPSAAKQRPPPDLVL